MTAVITIDRMNFEERMMFVFLQADLKVRLYVLRTLSGRFVEADLQVRLPLRP
jgi:predicted component of type VI protein secretion system